MFCAITFHNTPLIQTEWSPSEHRFAPLPGAEVFQWRVNILHLGKRVPGTVWCESIAQEVSFTEDKLETRLDTWSLHSGKQRSCRFKTLTMVFIYSSMPFCFVTDAKVQRGPSSDTVKERQW